MKIKTAEKLMWGMTVLFAFLRVLQYVFVIGKDGFFIKETLWQTLLSDVLYILMAAFAVLSFAIRIIKTNRYKTDAVIVCTSQTAILSLINAVILAAYAIVLLINKDWLGAVVLTASLYFVLLYFYSEGKNVPIMHYMAVFALAYPCMRVINMFFDTFKEIKLSENIIDMVAMCAMIIAMLALTKLCMGFQEKMSKFAWSISLYGGFGVLSGVGKLFGLFWAHTLDIVSVMAAVSDLALWILMLMIYHSCTTFEPIEEDEPVQEQED